MNLPEGLIAVLRQPSPCFLATLMPAHCQRAGSLPPLP